MFSRHYFRNWFWASLRCYLFKRGLLKSNAMIAVCKDGTKIIVHPNLYGFLVRGLFEGFFTNLRCKDSAVIAKNFAIPIEELLLSSCVAEAIRFGWRYDSSCSCWVRNDAKFKHMKCTIIEVFDFGEYRLLDAKNKVVVDVGAAYGDSTMYFLLRGAKKLLLLSLAHRSLGSFSRI